MLDDKVKLMTLIRLISYVKFDCKDYESSYFAGSPIVGEILGELKKKYSLIEGNTISLEVKIDSPFGRTLMKSLEWHISNVENWDIMESNSKIKHIVNLISPYYINEDIINRFIIGSE